VCSPSVLPALRQVSFRAFAYAQYDQSLDRGYTRWLPFSHLRTRRRAAPTLSISAASRNFALAKKSAPELRAGVLVPSPVSACR